MQIGSFEESAIEGAENATYSAEMRRSITSDTSLATFSGMRRRITCNFLVVFLKLRDKSCCLMFIGLF